MTQALFTLLGVLIATTAGFIGAWIASRQEHTRWLRDRRLAAYVDLRETLYEWESVDKALNDQELRMTELDRAIAEAEATKRDVQSLRTKHERMKEGHRDLSERAARLRQAVFRVTASFDIFGPNSVDAAVSRVLDAESADGRRVAMNQLTGAMREVLRIPS